jgi:D-3-phosphoglycerate dehydrogenase
LTHEQHATVSSDAELLPCNAVHPNEVTDAVRGADVAVVQFAPLTAQAIDGLAAGAAIIRYGIGFDNLDIAAANRRGVPAGYVPDYCIDEVADHTVALILAQLRKVVPLDASVRAGQWAAVAVAKPLSSYRETTIGFLGFGQIARAVADRLRPSGFRFIAADPMLDARQRRRWVSNQLIRTSCRAGRRALLHAPGTPLTNQFVNAARLARMKPTAFIVNSARRADR